MGSDRLKNCQQRWRTETRVEKRKPLRKRAAGLLNAAAKVYSPYPMSLDDSTRVTRRPEPADLHRASAAFLAPE